MDLYKTAGISETLDWAAALVALNRDTLDPATVDETLGVLLKHREDVAAVKGEPAKALIGRAISGSVR
jgi:hypothetical protein